MIPLRASFVLGLAIGCVALAGCHRSNPPVAKKEAAQVSVVQPTRRTLERLVEHPGAIHAYEEARLLGRIPGVVDNVAVDIGQSVRGPRRDSEGREIEPGEILATIFVPEIDEDVSHKRALVAQRKAEVEQAKKALASAEATIAAAEAAVLEANAHESRWRAEHKRIAGLVASGVIDAQTHDETAHQFRAAEARVQSAQASLRKAKADRDTAAADIATAEARVVAAEADARRAAAVQSFSTIRAPFDGIVTRRRINVGDIVPAAEGSPLFSVARLDPVRVVLFIPEADADFVRASSKATLTIPALGRKDVSSAIARTSWALEPGSRTLRAEIDLPNPDGVYRPGMYLSAKIATTIPDVWTLPSSAITRQADAAIAYAIVNDKAVRTVLRTGRGDGATIEILARQAGDRFVPLDGSERFAASTSGLSDGQSVKTPPRD